MLVRFWCCQWRAWCFEIGLYLGNWAELLLLGKELMEGGMLLALAAVLVLELLSFSSSSSVWILWDPLCHHQVGYFYHFRVYLGGQLHHPIGGGAVHLPCASCLLSCGVVLIGQFPGPWRQLHHPQVVSGGAVPSPDAGHQPRQGGLDAGVQHH